MSFFGITASGYNIPVVSGGFGTAFSAPSAALLNNSTQVSINSTGLSIAFAVITAPYYEAYAWSSSGYGSKYSAATQPSGGTAISVKYSPAGNAVFYGTTTVGGAYAWNDATGWGTLYTNLTVGVGTNYNRMAVNAAADTLFWTSRSGAYIYATPWNTSTGFGTNYANPATLLAGRGLSCSINPAETVLYVTSLLSPFVIAYAWTNGVGFGSSYSNPATLPPNSSYDVQSKNTDVVVSSSLTPFIVGYPWSSGWGTKYADPTTLPLGNGGPYGGAKFNSSTTQVVFGYYSASQLGGYPFTSGTGWGTQYTAPVGMPSAFVSDVVFNPAGNAVIASTNTSPYTLAYAWS